MQIKKAIQYSGGTSDLVINRFAGFEYGEGYLPVTDAVWDRRLIDGNILVQGKDGTVYNVHPKLSYMYRSDIGERQDCDPVWPIRWQLRTWDRHQLPDGFPGKEDQDGE